jgi:hypothetical protein
MNEDEFEQSPETTPQEKAEEAFVSAKAGFQLFGELLKPFTPSRKVAAQSMGMLYPFVGEGGLDQMNATGSYPGMLKDVIVCLWLCTLKDPSDQTLQEVKAGEWNPSRAIAKPTQALESAMGWAEKLGIMDMNGKKYREAAQVFMAIVSGVSASEFHLVVEDAVEGEEDDVPKV